MSNLIKDIEDGMREATHDELLEELTAYLQEVLTEIRAHIIDRAQPFIPLTALVAATRMLMDDCWDDADACTLHAKHMTRVVAQLTQRASVLRDEA